MEKIELNSSCSELLTSGYNSPSNSSLNCLNESGSTKSCSNVNIRQTEESVSDIDADNRSSTQSLLSSEDKPFIRKLIITITMKKSERIEEEEPEVLQVFIILIIFI